MPLLVSVPSYLRGQGTKDSAKRNSAMQGRSPSPIFMFDGGRRRVVANPCNAKVGFHVGGNFIDIFRVTSGARKSDGRDRTESEGTEQRAQTRNQLRN